MTRNPLKTDYLRRAQAAERQAILAGEVERRMGEMNLSWRQLSRAAGLNERYVRDLIKRGKAPMASTLAAIAKVLRCSVDDLQRGSGERYASRSPAQLKATRLGAARWACWEDPCEAAKRLGVSVTELSEMEAGLSPIPPGFLLRFSAVSGCPLSWLQDGGRLDNMRPEMAARIVYAAPLLLPRRDEHSANQNGLRMELAV